MAKKHDTTYLDCNASAPLLPCARQALIEHLDEYANPSSAHVLGQNARHAIDSARQTIQTALNARGRLIFTSGASEANAIALHAQTWQHVLLAPTEHDSLFVHAQHTFPKTIELLSVTPDGLVDIEEARKRVQDIRARSPHAKVLLVVTWAHNELGTYYSTEELSTLAQITATNAAALHVDAAQAVGKIPVNIGAVAGDHPALSVALSSHKVGGPKGIGALYTTHTDARPLTYGGGQEYALRPGSENTPAIAAFAAAVQHTHANEALWQKWQAWRDTFEERLQHVLPQAVILGIDAVRLPNTSCFALPPIAAETMLVALDLDNVAIGKGSACAQAKGEPSRTLNAIGQQHLQAYAMRASCGVLNKKEDFEILLRALQKNAKNIINTSQLT